MKTDQVTERQMNAYFLFLQWLADEMKYQGITLNKFIEVIDIYPTKDNLHAVFKAILSSKYQKDTTKGMTREEMNDCLNDFMPAIERLGLDIEFPDQSVRALLEYYSKAKGLPQKHQKNEC